MKTPKAFVRILLRNSAGQILVVASRGKSRREWNLPGGKVEPGENPRVAARRELFEETGLTVRSMDLVHEDCFRLGTSEWHGFFFEAVPVEYQAYNMEPDKLASVKYVNPSDVVERGSKSFLVDVLQRVDRLKDSEKPWQMQLGLETLSKKHSDDYA